MKVKAEGGGYSAIYTAKRFTEGWAFVQQDGTFLTPGIGNPMYYDNLDDIWLAIRDLPKTSLSILCDECGKAADVSRQK